MRIGLCCAVIFGFLIRNPFAVPVFAILLYFSFGQGGQSDIGQLFFRTRSADGRLHNGKKQEVPRYSEGMLIMYYMSIGLFVYTAVNIVLWFLFNYNFYIRFVVSAALVGAIVVMGRGGKKQVAGLTSTILLAIGGSLLFSCITALADDNGWTESGGTIGGLINNRGFNKSLWSSVLPSFLWDLGILFGWPLPGTPMPPIIPDVPIAPANPYDFPYRPKEWSLNDEGDISFVDPVTGKRVKYGLVGYDDNGNPRYIGENGSYYDLDELRNNYENARDHADYFRDANRGLEEWLAKQRAENQKLSRDGMQYLEDKWKWEAQQAKEAREAEQLFKMWQKYGGTLDDKDSIRQAAEKALGKAQKDAEYYRNKGEMWDKLTKTAEFTEKAADYSLTALSIVTGNKSIKKIYDITKKYAGNLSDAYANDKSMKMALISTTVDTLIDHATEGIGGTNWHYTAKMSGAIGGSVAKQAWKNLEQGKDWNEGMSTTIYNATVDYTSGKIGGITGGATGEAAKKIWSNLEEGKDWHDGVGSAAFNGGAKAGIDKIGEKINEYQHKATVEGFKNDTRIKV
ncbi:MAG: hypothetical protein IK078_09855, partial [Lachnospiraceae bacterium]|nr:hypothetical protein [Lachnospiraceae bacterium]